MHAIHKVNLLICTARQSHTQAVYHSLIGTTLTSHVMIRWWSELLCSGNWRVRRGEVRISNRLSTATRAHAWSVRILRIEVRAKSQNAENSRLCVLLIDRIAIFQEEAYPILFIITGVYNNDVWRSTSGVLFVIIIIITFTIHIVVNKYYYKQQL